MRADVLRVIAFAGHIDRAPSLDVLIEGLRDHLQPFGVTSLSVNLIHAPGRQVTPRSLVDVNWKAWSDQYGRRGHVTDDPAVRMLRAQTRPFAWSDALAVFGGARAQRVMDECAEVTGAREGFVVPVRDTDGVIMTAAFAGERLDLTDETRPALHLAGYYFATRGRELIDGIGLGEPCPLTGRQLECLEWVNAGKSDFEIGMILGCAPRTVHNHIEAAKAVLGVTKRSVAAFDAWRRGWIA